MQTTAIHISTELYNSVADYARQHNTDIGKMTERYFMSLLSNSLTIPKLVRPTRFSPELLKLVGIAKGTVKEDDLNGDEAKWEYIKEKYNL